MENIIATRIGYNQIFKAITFGLAAAYFVFSLIASPWWLFEFSYGIILITAAAVLYLVGYFIGGMAGRFIIIKKFPTEIVGILCGYFIVWIGSFAGSLLFFLQKE